jgi:conjugative relaxase-like TrwC/TraI family protein
MHMIPTSGSTMQGSTMLRFFTATSAYGVKKYFETADYYSQGNETVGHWGGTLAEQLGLSGPVTQEAFERLCDNLDPATDEQLTPRMNDNRRVGEDMIYSLPKDVGAAIMLASPERRDALLAIAGERANQVQGMIEADVQTRVRRHGAFTNRDTGNMCWAGFLHTTSRPVNGQPPDPHPHWHMFTFNATADPVEERIKAIEMANVYRDRPYYEAVFFSLVAKDFAERGYPIERRADGKWGFAGMQPLAATFSKRTDAIEETARQLNITQPGRKAELGAKTRAKKQQELSPEQLRAAWFDQLGDGDREALARLHGFGMGMGKDVTARDAVAFALDHLSEQRSAFPERELMRVALLHGLGNVTLEQVAAELPRQGVIVDVIDGRRMATTDALQQEERTIARIAGCGRGSVCPIGVADGLTRTMPDGKALNEGQWQAATGLLTSCNRVNLVEGPAGAGKSSMLSKFDEGMRRQGETVTYLASSTDAVGVLAKDGFEVHTVARFLLDARMQNAAAGGRVVVDETSMLGHKDAVKLLRLAEQKDLKLIFVGDPMQHGAVPRGAFLRVLKDYGGIQSFRLTEILRQETPAYRAAAGLLSEGKSLEGFHALDALGWVKELGDDGARTHAIAAEYVQALADNASVLVVSPTHAEAAGITAAIRGQLRAAGKLGQQEHAFTRLVSTNASEAERGQVFTYHAGDVLQFHQNARGFKKGDRLTVTDPALVPVELAGKFSVYRPETIMLAVGDRLRFTGNVATNGGGTLKNGANHTVAEITSNGSIRLDNGKIIAADAGHFRHGFVDTSFASQGKTVKRVILAMSSRSLPATNAEQLYVSASRGKESVSLYTDDKAAIASAIGRSSHKLAALDLKSDRQKEQERQRRLLEEYRQHQLRLATSTRQRSAWDHTPASDRPDTGFHPALGHAARRLAEEQGRDAGHGR